MKYNQISCNKSNSHMPYTEKFLELSKLKGFIPDACQLELAEKLSLFLNFFNNPTCDGWMKKATLGLACQEPQFNGMYVWGGVGRGKSVMINLFFDEANIADKKRIHFHEFMSKIHHKLEEIRHSDVNSQDHIKHCAKIFAQECRLLVIDELQINNIADAMVVGRLFASLIDCGVYIFFSSNRMPQDLFNDGLRRDTFELFIKLIMEKLDIFNLDNATDYRAQNTKIGNTYLYPINAMNAALVDNYIMQMTGGQKLVEKKIKIDENRVITAYQTYGNLAVFTFKELCEVSLGAKDYIAISSNFQAVVIKNIPQLKPENHNELLRFITLIDCFYEAGISLVCLSECQIDDLYLNGKHAFEFDRTISRLKSMHSADEREEYSVSYA